VPTLPSGIPDDVASAFTLARDTSVKLAAVDSTITDLNAKLQEANAAEAQLTIDARESLKAAESSLDSFFANLRASLESYVSAPVADPAGGDSGQSAPPV